MRLKSTMIFTTALVASLALAGCTAGGSGTEGSTPTAGASLTVAKPDGAIPPENNNPFVGDGSANKLGYTNAIYEPLAITNAVKPDEAPVPWLAKEITWSPDYTSVTLVARDGVTWNDGENFTADDIAYTFQLIKDTPGLDTTGIGVDAVTTDGDTVTISFVNPMYIKQEKVLNRQIVAKHVFEKISDPASANVADAVGTGPYTLKQYTNQSVELSARDDYWGGELAVPTLFYTSYNDNTALTTALATGEVDWAQSNIPNRQSAYLDKDAEHNVYWAPANLAVDTLFVNTTKAPFDDVAFRTAVNMVVDRSQYVDIAREGSIAPLKNVTGLPSPAGDGFVSSALSKDTYSVDVTGAKKVLTDAGYTFDGDTLKDPSGTPVTFTLTVPQGWTDYVTGISLIADSVKAIGVTAKTDTPDADTWTENIESGDFDAALHWTDGGSTPYDYFSDQMDGRWVADAADGKVKYNFGRFQNADASAALAEYASTSDDAARAAALEKMQQIFVDQVPTIPMAARPDIAQYNTRNYVGWPTDEDPYASADPTKPSVAYILTKLTAAP